MIRRAAARGDWEPVWGIGPLAPGVSVIELLLALWVVGTLSAMAIPSLLTAQERWRTHAAARYVMSRMLHARSEAARRGAMVGMRFEEHDASYRFGLFVDGDDDGVRTEDIANGTDPPILPMHRLSDAFPAVRFCVSDGVPLIGGNGGESSAGTPVRVGASGMLSFHPIGTSTSGTVYVCSPTGVQYAVRVSGATGRTRLLRFEHGAGLWQER